MAKNGPQAISDRDYSVRKDTRAPCVAHALRIFKEMHKLNFQFYQPTLPTISTSSWEPNTCILEQKNRTNKQEHVQNGKDWLNSHKYVHDQFSFYCIRSIKIKKRQSHREKILESCSRKSTKCIFFLCKTVALLLTGFKNTADPS